MSFIGLAVSQQEPQYSNYQMNNFTINPAVAGSYDYGSVKMGVRTQWVGMEGAPTTLFANFQTPIHHPNASPRTRRRYAHHGVGATLFSDQAGAIRYRGFNGSYALHSKLSKHLTLSIGASLGLKAFQLDESLLSFIETEDDPQTGNQMVTQMLPDGHLGAWLYSEHFFFGVAARQVLRSNISLSSSIASELNEHSRLFSHYFITSGGVLPMSEYWKFVPSFMVQYVQPAPPQVDLNGTFWFQEQVGMGFSYRHLDALYLIFDYVYEKQWEIGYAFDLTMSELRKYNSGTHEIIIGYRWRDSKSKSYCPSNFW